MIRVFRQFVVYVKVTVIVLLLLGMTAVVFMNRTYKTRFWPGAAEADVSTLWLILATAVVSVIVFWVLSKTRLVFKELAQIRAERASEEQLAAQQRLKEEIEQRERRIDEKLKKALDDDKSQV